MSSGGFNSGDRAVLQSTLFSHASPKCQFRFMYWAYNYPTWQTPSVLTVRVKSHNYGSQMVAEIATGERNEWQEQRIDLYSLDSFEIQFEVSRGDGPYGDISLDDFEFVDCSPEIPAVECRNPSDFLCSDGSRCIDQSRLCDWNPDCLDGSDELDVLCFPFRGPGSCNFEDPNWSSTCRLSFDETQPVEWIAVQPNSLTSGPEFDHTKRSGDGHVLTVDTFSIGEYDAGTSTEVETPQFPANPTGSCVVRFFYYFYRAKSSDGSGSLKLVSHSENGQTLLHAKYSLSTLPKGTSFTNYYNDPWQYASVPISLSNSFSIGLIMELDDRPQSAIAIDDLSFTKGCKTGEPWPGVGNDTLESCALNEVFCKLTTTCLPVEFICDGWCDCPDKLTESPDNCADERFCREKPNF